MKELKGASLSIVIPCFNCENTIAVCLASIETDYRIEIILVDDCSTDSTLEVLHDLKSKTLNRVIIVSNSVNSGAGAARNVGIRYASNSYVMFVDADDELLPGACQRILEEIDATSCDCLLFDAVMRSGNKSSIVKMLASRTASEGFIDTCMALVYGKGCSCGKVYKRDILLASGAEFLDIPVGEDVPFAKVNLAHSSKIYYLAETLYAYNDNPGSLMHTDAVSNVELPKLIYRKIHDALDGESFADELNSMYYILAVYPTIIAMLRRGCSNRECSNTFDSMAKAYRQPDKYFAALERKFRIAYILFKFHIFIPLKLVFRYE